MNKKIDWSKVADSAMESLEKDNKVVIENEKLDIDPYRMDNEVSSILEN